MRRITHQRIVFRPMPSAQQALLTVLAGGAAVGAIAQPLGQPRLEPALAPDAGARLLARPVAAEPAPKTIGLTGNALVFRPKASSRPEQEAAAELVPAVAFGGAPSASRLPLPMVDDKAPAALVQTRLAFTPVAGTTPALTEAATVDGPAGAEQPASRPLPMVDESTWRALTGGKGAYAPGERLADPRPGASDETPALASATQSSAAVGAGGPAANPSEGISAYGRTGKDVAFTVPLQINHTAAGTIPLLIADGENISVKLADVLAVLEPIMPPENYKALSESAGAQEYVTLNDLRAAGLKVAFGADDKLILKAS